MNLRHNTQVNKPLEGNNRFKLIDFYGEQDFNTWIDGPVGSVCLISVGYLVDMVNTNDSTQIEIVMHSNANGNDMYSYKIKVLYQER